VHHGAIAQKALDLTKVYIMDHCVGTLTDEVLLELKKKLDLIHIYHQKKISHGMYRWVYACSCSFFLVNSQF
jgi:hypothetical protein